MHHAVLFALLDVLALPVAVQLVAGQQAPMHFIPISLRFEVAGALEYDVIFGMLLVISKSLQRREQHPVARG